MARREFTMNNIRVLEDGHVPLGAQVFYSRGQVVAIRNIGDELKFVPFSEIRLNPADYTALVRSYERAEKRQQR